MNKREAVEIFRERLVEVIARSGMSRSKFAQSAGLERSTLTQLLSERTVRLPRLETLAAIAAGQQVSLDWLLGLRREDDIATGILPNMEIAEGAAGPADERLSQWQREAAGYKIRYVPTSLPDLLKTDDVIGYEFAMDTGMSPSARMAKAADKLAYSRKPETDIESCSSIQSVASFVRGEGVWKGLELSVRRSQVERMIELVDELYPTFRWFIFIPLYGVRAAARGDLYRRHVFCFQLDRTHPGAQQAFRQPHPHGGGPAAGLRKVPFRDASGLPVGPGCPGHRPLLCR